MSKRPRKKRAKPPERANARPPSPVRPRRPAGAKFRILAVLCLGGGIIGLFLAGSEWYTAHRLQTRGVETKGKFVNIDRLIKPGEPVSIKATVRYGILDGDGKVGEFQQATVPVSQQAYDRWKSSDAIPVRYLPEDPARCSIEATPPDLGEKLAIGGGAFLVGLILSYFAFYRWPRKARAEASETPA
ncbi:MAG: hypothetical protein U0800_08195 [Isosphaeraceae bacterium]